MTNEDYQENPAGTQHCMLLDEWNATSTAYPRDKTIHQLFEEQAALHPDSIALSFNDENWTYAELDERANALAEQLRRDAGVKIEVPVGICFERSPEMIAAMLAIVKAGGAYVPLDPAYPRERLAFMLGDAGIEVLVTQPHLKDALPDFAGKTIAIARGELDKRRRCEQVASNITPHNLAYVMFTSGSTGNPKGVMVPHRAVVRLVRNTNYCSFGADEVFLQLAPTSFDASTFEIWGALLNGARLAIMPPQTPSFDELGAAIRRHGVTTLWLTSGFFNVMAEQHLEDLRPLKQLLAGGDVLSPSHVQRVLAHLPCKLINGYGPTEGTTFSCCHVMNPGEKADASIPIGKPISNTQAYILGPKGEPLPPGEEGELYIGGDGLARGYWKRPELSAEKFVRNPFSSEIESRLYRTGDFARYRLDGTIEFLGRADNQVKCNGFRIELGEIESVLNRHSGVRDSVVAAWGAAGEKRIVAYLVPANGSLATGELRAFLREKLPGFMVPSAFVQLPALPLNANGKVDRHALPDPPEEKTRESAGALTELERIVSEIWCSVLEKDAADPQLNFFDMGGDSLQLLEMHSKLKKKLGCALQVTELFEHPTISAIARHLGTTRSGASKFDESQTRARKQREVMARQKAKIAGRA